MIKHALYYHGTDKESAREILKAGFKVGTYFALKLEDALGYGGPYIFEVSFPRLADPQPWQFTIPQRVPPSKIVRLTAYTEEVVEDFPARREELFLSNFGPKTQSRISAKLKELGKSSIEEFTNIEKREILPLRTRKEEKELGLLDKEELLALEREEEAQKRRITGQRKRD
jgi:hypothetical protein